MPFRIRLQRSSRRPTSANSMVTSLERGNAHFLCMVLMPTRCSKQLNLLSAVRSCAREVTSSNDMGQRQTEMPKRFACNYSLQPYEALQLNHVYSADV